MARSNSYGTLKAVGFGAAAIVGGTAIGLLIGGGRASHPSEQVVQQPAPELSVPAAPPATLRAHANGNYTAPGAPHIVIREESAPTLRRVDRTVPAPPADTEASQEAAPPVRVKPAKEPSDAQPADNAAGDAAPAPTTPATDTAPAADDSRPPAPPPAPADPDFERVGKPGDAESGQEGGKAQFRVQTGSYTDESNARSIADQLRGQGYTASTHSEREGDHLVYKVQAGAYRSKGGANKAAGDLQKKGFPAYVAPITP